MAYTVAFNQIEFPTDWVLWTRPVDGASGITPMPSSHNVNNLPNSTHPNGLGHYPVTFAVDGNTITATKRTEDGADWIFPSEQNTTDLYLYRNWDGTGDSWPVNDWPDNVTLTLVLQGDTETRTYEGSNYWSIPRHGATREIAATGHSNPALNTVWTYIGSSGGGGGGGGGGGTPNRSAAETAAAVPAGVTSAVTTLIDAVDDTNADAQTLGTLQAYEAGTGFASITAEHKRSILKGALKDILAKVTTAVPEVAKDRVAAFLPHLTGAALAAMPTEVEVRGAGSHSVDLTSKGMYCPLEDTETLTLTDTSFSPSKVFAVTNTSDVFSLTVDGTTVDLGSDNTPGSTYTWTDGTRTLYFTFGSVVVGGGATSGGSGDPYVAAMLD